MKYMLNLEMEGKFQLLTDESGSWRSLLYSAMDCFNHIYTPVGSAYDTMRWQGYFK